MSKPKIMFYTDGRHAGIYRYEPPMSKEEYASQIDELVGTSVEAVMFCLGEGRTMLHDTKAGELLGHNVDKWDEEVFRRAYQNAKYLIEDGNDPLRIVCERAQEKGMSFYATLIVQRGGPAHASDRCSDFRKNNPDLEIGAAGDLDPDFPGFDAMDFKHKKARDERFSIVEEVLLEYPVDGFELSLGESGVLNTPTLTPYFFHPKEIDSGRKIMTDWIGRIHETVKKSGFDRELVVRVPLSIEECLAVGFDPEEWVRQGIVDVLVGQGVFGQMNNFSPLVDITRGTSTRVHAVTRDDVGSDRLGIAPISALRATACNYWDQGIDGLYLAGWHPEWPFDARFYEKLRELPHPDIMAPKDKFYFVTTSESELTPLPVNVHLDSPARVNFTITDDIARLGKGGRVHEVLIRIRVVEHTELDILNFKLNGNELPLETHRMINEIYKQRVPHYRVMGGYWHIFRLGSDNWPVVGNNTIEVSLIERDPDMVKLYCVLRDIELEIKYLMGKNFHRGDGIGIGDVDPDLGPHD